MVVIDQTVRGLARDELVGRDTELTRIIGNLVGSPPRTTVLAGPAGVGKTALAREVMAWAADSGQSVVLLTGRPAAAHLPFGTFANLVADDLASGVAVNARRTLLDRAGSQTLLVVVDDAQWLDEPAAAVLWQLVDSGQVVLLATIRSGEPLTDSVLALWKDRNPDHIELRPLADSDVGAMCRALLDGDVDPLLEHAVSRLAAGLPLLVRELVAEGVATGAITSGSSGWTLRAELVPPERAVVPITSRLGRLTPGQRDALELVALGEPVLLPWLLDMTDAASVDALAADGLIRVDDGRGRRPLVWLGHPLVGDAIRVDIAPSHRAWLLDRLASCLRQPLASPSDRIRYVRWRLEAGATVEPELLRATTMDMLRLGDYRGARHLATVLQHEQPTAATGHLLGHVLTKLAEGRSAEAVLADAATLASTDHEVALIAAARGDNLLVNLDQADAAVGVVLLAESQVSDPGCAIDLRSARSLIAMSAGDHGTAMDLSLPDLDVADDRRFVVAAIWAAYALAYDLRPQRALDVASRAHRTHLELAPTGFVPLHPDVHRTRQVSALLWLGELHRADELAAMLFEERLDSGIPEGLPTMALHRSAIAFERGQLALACDWATRAAVYLDREGIATRRRWALSLLIRPAAQLGRFDVANAAADELARPTTQRAYDTFWIAGLGWIAWREGRSADAWSRLEEAALLAETTRCRTLAVQPILDLAVLGAPERAAPIARRFRPDAEGPLLTAKLDAVVALAERDHESLTTLGSQLGALGAHLAAAELFGQAAALVRASSRPREADRLCAMAARHEAQCDGARAESLSAGSRVTPLTPREREVALLAAAGRPSKRIASDLAITRRTVDNLLLRVYRKLGATGREDLAELL